MIRLFIEEQELDVNEGFSHQITYAIDDLQNLDSKATAFSKTIVLPGTATNNRLLGNIFEFGNSNQTFEVGANVGYSFNASKSAKARLEVNGLQVIKGVLRLLEIIRDGDLIEYEIAIFGELGGFVSKLGNLRLEDLDFSEYNQAWNVTNIFNSWEFGNEITVPYATFTNISSTSSRLRLIGNYTQFSIGMQIIISGSDVNDGTYTITNITFSPGFPVGRTNVFFNSTVTNDEQTTPFTIEIPRVVSEGAYFPLIDYGNVSTDKLNYSYKAFRPAFFVREYLDKIIKNSGYTWSSSFFNSDFFCRLIIPNNAKALYNKNASKYIDASTVDKDFENTNFSTTLFDNQSWELPYDSYSLNSFSVYINAPTDQFHFINDTAGGANIKTTAKITGNYSSYRASKIGIQLIKSTVADPSTQTILQEVLFENNRTVTNFSFDLTGIETYNVNDTIYVKVVINLRPNFGSTNSYGQINIDKCSLVAETDPPGTFIEYNYGETLIMNDLIPTNIFQKDFFTSILKMFYLMVTEDKQIDKHLVIEPYVGFYNLDPASYLDWSDIIDRSQVIKIKPMSEVNSRYYSLKYKSDSDFYNENYRKKYNEGYGDIIYDNGYEFAKETDTTEVIFAPTPLVGYDGRDKIVSSIFKINNAVEDSVAHIIRIMQVKKITGVEYWNIYGATSNLLEGLTDYPYAGHFDDPDLPAADINFGIPKEIYFPLVSGAIQNNLFNSFYSNHLAEITDKDSRLVTATIKLTEQQIFNLDFGRFIFLDGILYRLQRIVDYSAGELCKVELLRVINAAYGNELNPYEKYTKITFEKNVETGVLLTETLYDFNMIFTGNANSYSSFKIETLQDTYELYLYGGNNIELNYYNLSGQFYQYVLYTLKFEDFGCITSITFAAFSECQYMNNLSLPLLKEIPLLFGNAMGVEINNIIIKLPFLEVWNDIAFSTVYDKNIELTIPANMVSNGNVQDLIANNNVTIIEV